MNADFPRVLTLLRKEKGISQKEVASRLGISQALLSHYEKGIRECGLDFLVSCAKFYGVSVDYMLGLSPETTGSTIRVEDIPEADAMGKENVFSGSVLPILNKKLITNSLNILFDLLSRTKNEKMITEVSDFLMLSVYRMFRLIYRQNPKNLSDMFSLSDSVQQYYAMAAMQLSEAGIVAEAGRKKTKGSMPPPTITTDSLSKDYPLFSASLMNLVRNSEKTIQERCKL